MIKIGIQTEQGFLSFTPAPDGKTVIVEYRASQGGWETIALPGLEEAITAIVQQVVGGGGSSSSGGTTPPAEGDWLGIPPSKSAEYVAAVKAHLESQGANLSGPCGAFAIVENVAYGLRNTGAGTFFKDSGNNCRQRSTDIVAYKDLAYGCARLVDILGDAGNLNTPMWGERSEEEDITRWMSAAYPAPSPGSAGTRTAPPPAARTTDARRR